MALSNRSQFVYLIELHIELIIGLLIELLIGLLIGLLLKLLIELLIELLVELLTELLVHTSTSNAHNELAKKPLPIGTSLFFVCFFRFV